MVENRVYATTFMPTKVCECCGQDIPERVERYGVAVDTNPFRAWIGEVPVEGIKPMGLRYLYLFLKNGAVSIESLAFRGANEDLANHRTVHTHIVQLRHALLAEFVPIEIITVDQWGYLIKPMSQAKMEANFVKLKRRERVRKLKIDRQPGERREQLATRVGGKHGHEIAKFLEEQMGDKDG